MDNMNKFLAPAAIVLAGFAAVLAGFVLMRPAPPVPVPATATDTAAIESTIRDYLMRNPEIVREAILELQRRADEEEAQARVAALEANREMLFDSPRGVVIGNPEGDVAVVEFFDYNCGYCKRALDDMDVLLKADPDLKFVMKEFPVLGQASVEAARVSIAIRMQDTDGTLYDEFHRRLLAVRGRADLDRSLAVAREVGADMSRIETDMKSNEVEATLIESMTLAEALGINGTPSYVIGDEVVPGAVGAEALKQRIAAVRECGKARC